MVMSKVGAMRFNMVFLLVSLTALVAGHPSYYGCENSWNVGTVIPGMNKPSIQKGSNKCVIESIPESTSKGSVYAITVTSDFSLIRGHDASPHGHMRRDIKSDSHFGNNNHNHTHNPSNNFGASMLKVSSGTLLRKEAFVGEGACQSVNERVSQTIYHWNASEIGSVTFTALCGNYNEVRCFQTIFMFQL